MLHMSWYLDHSFDIREANFLLLQFIDSQFSCDTPPPVPFLKTHKNFQKPYTIKANSAVWGNANCSKLWQATAPQ